MEKLLVKVKSRKENWILDHYNFLTDRDECNPNKPGGGGAKCDTGSGAVCVNSPVGSYSCTCPPGKELDKTGKHCENTNECNSGTHNCTANSQCIDLDPGFKCICKSGFVLVNGSVCVGQ